MAAELQAEYDHEARCGKASTPPLKPGVTFEKGLDTTQDLLKRPMTKGQRQGLMAERLRPHRRDFGSRTVSLEPVPKRASCPPTATTGASAASTSSSFPARPDFGIIKAYNHPEGTNTALVDGVWQTDGSRHAVAGQVTLKDSSHGTVQVLAQSGKSTLKVAYFYSGPDRKASVADWLSRMCQAEGFGLEFHEIDILIGGSSHDLMDKNTLNSWITRIEDGEFDIVILSPPCGSWSRANYADDKPPQPCRSREFPWGLPNNNAAQRKRAENGNAFVHASIRIIATAAQVKKRGKFIRCLLEHPEDLGRTHRGIPGSIWQLQDLKLAAGETATKDEGFKSVAGHQCGFKDGPDLTEPVDRAKPTRLYSDLLGVEDFGHVGWPTFDPAGWYFGPLPRSCGHRHRQPMIGKNKAGG